LLIGGASPNCLTRFDRAPLHAASEAGNTTILSALLCNTTTDVDVVDNGGFSSLMLASTRGHVPAVEMLLEFDTDVTLRSSTSKAALDLAAFHGHIDVMQAVLHNGADVDAVYPLSGYIALHDAITRDRVGAVVLLLSAGADVKNTTVCHLTPLHFAFHPAASASGMLTLLKRGATANELAGYSGCNALHVACSLLPPGVDVAVDLLLRWGASETTPTPLAQAKRPLNCSNKR